MDTERKSTVLCLCLITFGLFVMSMVVLKSMQTATSIHRHALLGEAPSVANWFTERSLSLLEAMPEQTGGIDFALARKKSPFKRIVRAAPVEAEPAPAVVVEVEPPPAPEPIETKMIEVLYSGLYTTAQGVLKVYLTVEGRLRILGVGETVAGDWVIGDATSRELILKQEGGDEVFMTFNSKKMLEVPIE